jgi:BMFP domain-containing protein YqiC|tara:strand:+ start:2170 stop:2385 length:216 start_codon:yes stop_codon:yes gene_type:complete
MGNDYFTKLADDLSSILPKSAKEAKEDIQKNLTFLIKEAVQKMDLVERSEIDELKKEIESLKNKIKTSNKN